MQLTSNKSHSPHCKLHCVDHPDVLDISRTLQQTKLHDLSIVTPIQDQKLMVLLEVEGTTLTFEGDSGAA